MRMFSFAVLLVAVYCFSSRVDAQAPISCAVNIQAYGGVATTACPEGFVDVNGKRVWTGRWCTADLAIRKRGVNTIILDTDTCAVSDQRVFDTWASDDEASDLANYIDYLAKGKVLIGVTGDDATAKLTNAKRELRIAGVRVEDVKLRGSFAFVLQVGSPEKTLFAKEIDSAINPNAKLTVNVKNNRAGWIDLVKA